MKKIIYNKFDKKSIAQLPKVAFPGKTVVVMSESEAEKAVEFLLSQDILGVDTETRPSFRRVNRTWCRSCKCLHAIFVSSSGSIILALLQPSCAF